MTTAYCLLKPVQMKKLEKDRCQILTNQATVHSLRIKLSEFDKSLIAIDIETTGVRAHSDEDKIVGVGLAQEGRALYLDLLTAAPEVISYLFNWLASPGIELMGHNLFFDSAFLTRDNSSRWLNYKYDTYGLYRHLATEGWEGQKWSLKTAQVELLGWTSTNETELDKWLIDNDYISDIKLDHKPGYYPTYIKGQLRYAKPDKGKMSNAPADILGYYCCLDCQSTYDFFINVLAPAIHNLGHEASKQFQAYHQVYINHIRLHVEQQLRGMFVDTDRLNKHRDKLVIDIKEAEDKFFGLPEIQASIAKYNQAYLTELKAKEPAKYKKLPLLGKQPAKYKKDGSVSKTYLKWLEKREQVREPVISKNWQNWNDKYSAAKAENHFNLNSGKQRQWLFYEELKYPVVITTPKGEPAVDKRALLSWGEPGQLLKKSNDLVKEQGYVDGCFNSLNNGSTVHPQFRLPGTLTGRLAGSGGVNFQQLPKSRGYLDCFRARPGYVFATCDFASLEQVILTELSKDPTLYRLYGPNAVSNDVYLFNGYYLPPMISDPIKEAGYNPDNPTPEAIANAKKVAKKQRGISKAITLGSSYGMGAKKLAMTLQLQGVDCSIDDAVRMHASYWELYKGVKLYEKYLIDEHRRRGGYILNGIGRPIGVYNDLLKDIVNRQCQSTGHDVLMIWVQIISRLVKQKEIECHGIIWDYHDESIVEVREEDGPRMLEVFTEAYDILNYQLQGDILLKGDPELAYSLAEIKIED